MPTAGWAAQGAAPRNRLRQRKESAPRGCRRAG